MQIQDLAYFDDYRVQQAKIQPVAQADLGSGGRGWPVGWGFWIQPTSKYRCLFPRNLTSGELLSLAVQGHVRKNPLLLRDAWEA